MGDWWLDETPWPGPIEQPPIQLIQEFNLYISRLGGAFGVAADIIGGALTKTFHNFQDAYDLMPPPLEPSPHIAGMCCYDGTKEEKRVHALWLVRNRNVGPQFYYHFDHRGKKIH